MHRWKHSALAAAILVSAGLYTNQASALSLGSLRVQSSLGEPLRAQIPVTQLSEAEAESLQANPASPDIFNQNGAIYSPIMAQLQISLQRRADGTAVLQLNTHAPINEPFLDLVLNASWNGGQLIRSYALLLDPPTPQSVVPAIAQPQNTAAATPAPVTAVPKPAAAPQQRQASQVNSKPVGDDTLTRARNWQNAQRAQGTVTPAPVAQQAQKPRSQPAAQKAESSALKQASSAAVQASSNSVRVRKGENAGRIARNNLPPNVSLDQMLVALQRANPEAFIQGNVNLLKADATLQIPDADTIQAISSQEARNLIAAQTQDFKRYQGQVARAVPRVKADGDARTSTGGVTTQVTDTATSGRPELVVGSAPDDAAAKAEENKLAQERQQQEDREREEERLGNIQKMKELEEQIAELARINAEKEAQAKQAAEAALAATAANSANTADQNKTDLGIKVESATPAPGEPSAPTTTADSTPTTAAATPEEPKTESTEPAASTTAEKAEPTTDTAKPAEAPVAAPVPEKAPEPAPQPKPVAPPPPPPPAPVATAGILDDYPMLPWAAGALAVLLAGYGAYRWKQGRSNGENVVYENSGNNIPGSFFDADSKSKADTASGQSTASSSTGYSTGVSSMSYSPSQIDATGEGDPVLEADVLMAYGRDQQAEEVLKEAEQHNPGRPAIKVRLAEIYATRQDRLSFNAIATTLHTLTQAQGPDWEKVAELGRNLDSSNPLFRESAVSSAAASAAAVPDATDDKLNEPSDFGPLSGLDFDIQPSGFATDLTSKHDIESISPATKNSHLAPLDLDLDLDLNSAPIIPSSAPTSSAASQQLNTTAAASLPDASVLPDLDLNLESTVSPASSLDPLPEPERQEQQDEVLSSLSFADTDGLNFDASSPILDTKASDEALTKTLEFDLSALSLDADNSTRLDDTVSFSEDSTFAGLDLDSSSNDPLATKLALAKEFYALGDAEGSKALAQEVLNQSSGELKAKAEKFFAQHWS